MVRLKCYEPAHLVFALSRDDMSRHIIAFGATGSGKTTSVINPTLRQLINHQDRMPPGILVLDPKGDDTPHKVLEYAKEAGREKEVVTLSFGGSSYYDFFGSMKRLEQVDEYARRALYGSTEMGLWNSYWTEARLGLMQAVLTLVLAGPPLDFDGIVNVMRAFIAERASPVVQARLEFVDKLLQGELRPVTRRRLELVKDEAKNWASLDPRTRELHKSTWLNALRPLMSPALRDLFVPHGHRFEASDVLRGNICVVSFNAIREPQLVALLCKCLKRDFYEAVLSRRVFVPKRDRACALVVDELPLSVTLDQDLQALATLRSHGGMVVAAAQGINALDAAIGSQGREALLNNFGTFFFFCGRENALDEFAGLTLGSRQIERRPEQDIGGAISVIDTQLTPRVPICPPGTLARLPQHHCFVKLASGVVTESPVWLESLFHDFAPAPSPEEPDELADAVAKLTLQTENEQQAKAGATLLLKHMHQKGHRLLTTSALVAAAWQLCAPSLRQGRLRELLRRYRFKGLDDLPPCWALGLVRWLQKRQSIVRTILEVSQSGGALWVQLDGPSIWWGDGAMAVPEALNRYIYPSLWRPLKRRHWAQLYYLRPDLRQELLALPQAAQGQSV